MVPDFVAELVERVAFVAREDKRIDRRSGVSQRMPISVMENVDLERGAARAHQPARARAVPRVADVYAALPAITGKIELEYEGELQGRRDDRAGPDPPRGRQDVRSERAGGANVDDIVHVVR